MRKESIYKSLLTIVKSYLYVVKNDNKLHKQLKDILVVLHKNDYIGMDVSYLDIRTNKDKELLIEVGYKFINANLISTFTLQERGWTKELIKQHLGIPDLLENINKFKHVPYLELYSLCRVEKLETRECIKAYLVENQSKLPEEIKKGTNILVWIKSLPIEIPKLDLRDLLEQSIKHNNELSTDNLAKHDKLDRLEVKTMYTQSHILERICKNYIRHKLTNYENLIHEFNLITNKNRACLLLKEHINQLINTSYPNLKNTIYKYQQENDYIKDKSVIKRSDRTERLDG